MKTLIIVGIALAALSLTALASHAQSLAAPPVAGINSVVVPGDDPAYQDEDTIGKAGVPLWDLIGNGRQVWPRRQFALAVVHLLPFINADASSKTKMSAMQREILDNLDTSAPAITALHSLTVEFAPEIRQMNQDPVAIEKRLDELLAASPFPDVPKGHWAYSAVTILRKTGIVVGYQDGSY